VSAFAFAAQPHSLAGHPSAYLAMHAADPVRWQDWGPEILETARAENKPVLISSGYFACHWCHVMQRESFRDPGVAERLNRDFIAVKLDRELDPAIDAHLIEFVELTRGQAGWPLNVFLTPDGYPFAGVLYEPRGEFFDLLGRLAEAWRTHGPKIADLARRAGEELAGRRASGVPAELPADLRPLRTALVIQAMELADELGGGFGQQSRFPMAPQLLVLLDLAADEPEGSRLRTFLRLTLDQMAGQGLRDHIGGGFFRYTVDPDWQTPHFEKMLYDQALLARVYLKAAAVLAHGEYLDVARDTLEFILREMRRPDGAFISSLSAVDGTGIEGGAYLWTAAELDRLLPPELLLAARARWTLPAPGDAQATRLPLVRQALPQVAAELGIGTAEASARIRAARALLLDARGRRSLPRDGKAVAGWNGLVLTALADAVRSLDDPRYREAGSVLQRYLAARLWDGRALPRALSADGKELGASTLEDYAYVAEGLRAWAGITASPSERELADAVLEQTWARFFGPGGWRTADRPELPGLAVSPFLDDGPLPAPSAIALGLELASPDPLRSPSAAAALRLSYAGTAERPFWRATHAAVLLEGHRR